MFDIFSTTENTLDIETEAQTQTRTRKLKQTRTHAHVCAEHEIAEILQATRQGQANRHKITRSGGYDQG